ncbi:amidohydrolase family protein [Microbacterium sp. zg.B185]|nr:amidohydrolase family protein [Microbacterium sp. zg.B185]MCR2808405.1 amidohydrolase [Microbacterium sp. zg.B185]
MIIDCHAHVIPHDFLEGSHPAHPCMAPAGVDGSRTLTIGDVEFLASPVWFNADVRLEAMDAAGVDMEVVSPMPPILNYRLDDGAAVAIARHVNESIAGLVAAGEGRIQGLGTVPLQYPDLAAAELLDVVGYGLRGVEVASHVNGVSIGDPRFLDFFREVERLGLSVFVHAIGSDVSDRLPKQARTSFGFAMEASIATASLITGGTLEACPQLRISISHGGGGALMMAGRAQFFATREWARHDPESQLPNDSPLGLARRLYYDSLMFDTRAIDFLAHRVGIDRILLGSDFPAISRASPAVAPLTDFYGGDEGVAIIAGSNALSFLAIEESGL